MTPAAPDARGAPGRIRMFGGVLATDRPLPGLPVAPHESDGQFALWHLDTVDAGETSIAHSPDARIHGRIDYSNGVTVSLGIAGATAEVLVADTGRFTIAADGVHITHLAPPNVDRAAVALDLIGVVLPLVLHRDGAWCVHASAVLTSQGVIAFVAERGTGKSTLAAACVRAGCALVADDVLVLRESAAGVDVTPAGVPMRLREDAARAVGFDTDETDNWGKVRVKVAPAQDSLPLAAVYVLHAAAAGAVAERVPRATRAAALALLTHGKVTALLGTDGAADALTRCVSLAYRAHAYDLAVPRDLAQVEAVATQLLRWHAETVLGGAAP